MSVEISHEGKHILVIIPSEIADGCLVQIVDCPKTQIDEDCNWCTAKYACKLFCSNRPKLIPVVVLN